MIATSHRIDLAHIGDKQAFALRPSSYRTPAVDGLDMADVDSVEYALNDSEASLCSKNRYTTRARIKARPLGAPSRHADLHGELGRQTQTWRMKAAVGQATAIESCMTNLLEDSAVRDGHGVLSVIG